MGKVFLKFLVERNNVMVVLFYVISSPQNMTKNIKLFKVATRFKYFLSVRNSTILLTKIHLSSKVEYFLTRFDHNYFRNCVHCWLFGVFCCSFWLYLVKSRNHEKITPPVPLLVFANSGRQAAIRHSQ